MSAASMVFAPTEALLLSYEGAVPGRAGRFGAKHLSEMVSSPVVKFQSRQMRGRFCKNFSASSDAQ